MVKETTKETAEPMAACVRMMKGMEEGESPMTMCPMAKAFRRMTEKPPSLMLMLLPGIVLIALGVVIIFQPQVLVWFMGALAILVGIALLTMATFIRRLANRWRNAHQLMH